jgi:hypothetical protein
MNRIAILFLLLTFATHAAPVFRDFMGINGHTIQFKPELYKPVVELVRDYHPVEWDLGKNSDFATKFPLARNGVDWERVYGSWKKEGLRVDVCLMFESLAREKWKDVPADAHAYGEAFARAFGPSSPRALVETVEIGNEPGKWSDADYRAMFENMARGLRAGDPKLRIVTCALTTGKSHAFAKSVECVAGLEDLIDVLNVHSYPELERWPTWRRSFPEDPRLKAFLPDITNLCRWRDAHAPKKEVWLTEFGYDSSTKEPDPKTEFKKWVGVTDEQQAQWLVRSWLLLATLPINRAYVYFFNDSDQPQVHGSSGLTRNFQPKPSFYAAAQLKKNLGDFKLKRQFKSGEATVEEFENERKRIWVAWLASGAGAKAKFTVPDTERVERMALKKDDDVALRLTGHEIEIGESPIYLYLK